jgi:hypothetical protein
LLIPAEWCLQKTNTQCQLSVPKCMRASESQKVHNFWVKKLKCFHFSIFFNFYAFLQQTRQKRVPTTVKQMYPTRGIKLEYIYIATSTLDLTFPSLWLGS